jgi:hypothetical protein
MRLALGAVAVCVAAAQDPSLDRTFAPAASWRARFVHDEKSGPLHLSDIQARQGSCAIAFGFLDPANGTRRGAVVRSTDEGENWSLEEVPETPRSGFLLDEKRGWMVTDHGIWRTTDCGGKWEKLASQTGLLRAYFIDEHRGYAAGISKQAIETRDGGKSWNPLAAVEDVKSEAGRSQFHWIDFGGSFGMIVGAHEPRRTAAGSEGRRQLPSLVLTLQSLDGGGTWRGSAASILGRVTRVRLSSDGTGLAVVEFREKFDWPSEVYRLEPRAGRMVRTFRETDRAAKDAIALNSGVSYIAAIEPPGRDWRLSVPGKVRIARSLDQLRWQEMRVDYRAVATGIVFAAVGSSRLLAAVDNGMILRLEN